MFESISESRMPLKKTILAHIKTSTIVCASHLNRKFNEYTESIFFLFYVDNSWSHNSPRTRIDPRTTHLKLKKNKEKDSKSLPLALWWVKDQCISGINKQVETENLFYNKNIHHIMKLRFIFLCKEEFIKYMVTIET